MIRTTEKKKENPSLRCLRGIKKAGHQATARQRKLLLLLLRRPVILDNGRF
jgi:hypothetical protein